MQASNAEDIINIPIVNSEYRAVLAEIHNMSVEKMDREVEAKERSRKLSILAADVKLKFFRNLKILKSFEEKGRTDQRMWKVIMRILGQCTYDLHNLHNECNNFRIFMGKSEEEMCATNHMFNELITFTKQAQPAMQKWQERTHKLMRDIKLLKLIRQKSN